MNGLDEQSGGYTYGSSAQGFAPRWELSPESEPVVVGSKVLLMYGDGDIDVVEVVFMDHAHVVVRTESGKQLSTVHESIGLGVNDDLTFVLEDGCTTFDHKETPVAQRLFTPSYPKLFAQPGVRCSKVTHRSGRVSLQCVRREHGAEVNHLMDIMDRDAQPGWLAPTDEAVAYEAGWKASARSKTFDLDAAEARFEAKHGPRFGGTMFAAGWADYSSAAPYGLQLDTDKAIDEAVRELELGNGRPVRQLVERGIIPTDAPVALRASELTAGPHLVDPTCSCQPCVLATETPTERIQRVNADDGIHRPEHLGQVHNWQPDAFLTQPTSTGLAFYQSCSGETGCGANRTDPDQAARYDELYRLGGAGAAAARRAERELVVADEDTRVAQIVAELDAFVAAHPGATIADALYETSDQYRLREWNAVARSLIASGRAAIDAATGLIVATSVDDAVVFTGEVIEPAVQCGCGTGTVSIDPAARAAGANDEHVHSPAHMAWIVGGRPRSYTCELDSTQCAALGHPNPSGRHRLLDTRS